MQRGAHAFPRAASDRPWRASHLHGKEGVRRRSRRLQGCAPAEGGDQAAGDPAPAGSLFANRRGCDREAGAFRGVPRRRRGSAAGSASADPAGEQTKKKMHRVGVAFVQLTRSTFAEATAGRECLQPPALRARCNWKDSARFRVRQAHPNAILSQIATINIPVETSACSSGLVHAFHNEMHRARCSLVRLPLTAAEATACRRAINLGRSVLGAPGTLGPRGVAVKHRENPNSALCGLFITPCTHLR